MNRRGMLSCTGAALLTLSSRWSRAQEPNDIEIIGELPPLPTDLQSKSNQQPAPYKWVAGVGTGKPKDDEIIRAYEILIGSPYNTSHMDVIEYFLELSGDDAKYRREWPERTNPVIYHFFSATGTQPEGDTTAWCAASLNWILLRARAKDKKQIGIAPGHFSISGMPFSPKSRKDYSTGSAASGSFRCLPDITSEPRVGDILVLANKGTHNLTKVCAGQGHVAIFNKRIDDDRVECWGGNQTLKGSNGAITMAKIRVGEGSRFLKFVKPYKA